MNKYTFEIINGGLDGLITSFSLITASLGGKINMKTLLLLGITGILVDAYSMGVSRFLTTKTEKKKDKSPFISAVVLGVAFILFGIIPIIPLLIISPTKKNTVYISIIISLLTFYAIGHYKAELSNESSLKSGVETSLMGVSAAVLSYAVSFVVNKFI